MAAVAELSLEHLTGALVTQCIVVEWHRQDGEPVCRGDAVATVETRKVTAELEAKAEGILRHKYRKGDYLDITDIVGWIEPYPASKEAKRGGVGL